MPIVDENVGRAGRVGAVHQIVEASVQQQRVAIGVEEDRRKRVVVMIDDQLSRGARSSASASGREDMYGSNTTSAMRAA